MSVDQFMHNFFFNWGLFVYRFRRIFLIFPIILTGLLALGLLRIKELEITEPEYVFSPEDAPWHYERAVLKEHWPVNENRFWPGKSYDYTSWTDIVVWGKALPDGRRPNMLDLKYLNETIRVSDYVYNTLSINITVDGESYRIGYQDLCMMYEQSCYDNGYLHMLKPSKLWANFSGEFGDIAQNIAEEAIQVTYPIASRGGEPIYMGALVARPHIVDAEGHFDYVMALRLTYNLREGAIQNISRLWHKKLTDYIVYSEPSPILEFGFYRNGSLNEGLKEVSEVVVPKFLTTFLLLTVYTAIFSFVLMNRNGFISIDWVRSKPNLALAGVMNAIMAIASAYGAILLSGTFFNSIANVTPFLVMSIAVDDMFVLSAAWHRTNPLLPTPQRLGHTLAEATVSITITSLTDSLSFATGCLTTLPGIRLFCLYVSVGIVFTYFYEVTFFAAVMSFCGDMEQDGKHALPCIEIAHSDSSDDSELSLTDKVFKSGARSRSDQLKQYRQQSGAIESTEKDLKNKEISNNANQGIYAQETTVTSLSDKEIGKSHKKFSLVDIQEYYNKLMRGNKTATTNDDDIEVPTHRDDKSMMSEFFNDHYGPFLMESTTKVCVLLLFLIYVGISIIGCLNIQAGLPPKLLVLEDYYATRYYDMMDQTFWRQGLQVQLVSSSPPDFSNGTQAASFLNMMNELEDTYYIMPRNATMFWYYHYVKYLQVEKEEYGWPIPNNTLSWYKECRTWLLSAQGRRLWDLDTVWGEDWANETEYNTMYAFRLQLGMRNMQTPFDLVQAVTKLRTVASEYPQFNVTTFHEHYPFADQDIQLQPSLIQNCGLAIVMMIIIAFILIPHYGAALCISAAMFSIDLGVVGFMTFWGVTLDTISMIALLMSIGFSVNLSSHITYAYVKCEGSAREKAIFSLKTLGYAVFLGAFSTILGMLILAFVPTYMATTFFKTVFLVIVLGLVHSLVFLPVLLSVALPGSEDGKEKSKAKKISSDGRCAPESGITDQHKSVEGKRKISFDEANFETIHL